MEAKLLSDKFTRRSFLAGLSAAAALPILAACEPQVVEKVVEKPVEVVVTQVVEKVVEKEVVVQEVVEVEKEVVVEVEKEVVVEKETIVEVPAAKDPITIFWLGGGGDTPAAMIKEWQEMGNEHISFEVLDLPASELYIRIETGWTAGAGPDIAFTGGATKRYAAAGWAVWVEPFMPKGDYHDFYKVARDCVSWNDRMYAFPFSSHGQPLMFRKDVLEEAGVDWTQAPETYDDILQIAKKVQKKSGDTWEIIGYWINSDPGKVHMSQGYVYGNGGGWVEDDDSVLIDHPGTIKTVQMFSDWLLKEELGPAGGHHEDVWGSNFADGKLAIVHTAVQVVRKVVEKLGNDDTVGAWHIPPGDVKRSAFSYHNNFMPHSRSKVWEEATKFTQWITNTDNMIRFNEVGRAPMPRISATEKAEYTKDPRWQIALEAAGVYGDNEGKSRFSIPIRDHIIEPAMTRAFFGQMSAEEAMTGAANEARDLIENELKVWDRDIEQKR